MARVMRSCTCAKPASFTLFSALSARIRFAQHRQIQIPALGARGGKSQSARAGTNWGNNKQLGRREETLKVPEQGDQNGLSDQGRPEEGNLGGIWLDAYTRNLVTCIHTCSEMDPTICLANLKSSPSSPSLPLGRIVLSQDQEEHHHALKREEQVVPMT